MAIQDIIQRVKVRRENAHTKSHTSSNTGSSSNSNEEEAKKSSSSKTSESDKLSLDKEIESMRPPHSALDKTMDEKQQCSKEPTPKTQTPQDLVVETKEIESEFLAFLGVPHNARGGCEDQQTEQHDHLVKVLKRLSSENVPDKVKLTSLKTISTLKAPMICEMKSIISNTDLLVRCVKVSLECAMKVQMKGAAQEVLIRVLQMLHQLGIHMPKLIQDSFKQSPVSDMMTVVDLLLTTSNPLKLTSPLHKDPIIQKEYQIFLSSIEGQEYLILSEKMPLQKTDPCLEEDFLRCLNLSTQLKSILPHAHLTSNSSLINIFVQTNKEEIPVAEKLIEADTSGQLVAFQFPDVSGARVFDCLQTEIVKIFESGHVLVYLGGKWKQELTVIEQTVLRQIKNNPDVEKDLTIGKTVFCLSRDVSWEEGDQPRASSPPLACRGLVVSDMTTNTKSKSNSVKIYFQDLGAIGTVKRTRLFKSANKLSNTPPVLSFCRMQGLTRILDMNLIVGSLSALKLLSPVMEPGHLNKVLQIIPTLFMVKNPEVQDAAMSLLDVSIKRNLHQLENWSNFIIKKLLGSLVNICGMFDHKKNFLRLLDIVATLMDYTSVRDVETFLQSIQTAWDRLPGSLNAEECAPFQRIKNYLVIGTKQKRKEEEKRRKSQSRARSKHSGSETRSQQIRQGFIPVEVKQIKSRKINAPSSSSSRQTDKNLDNKVNKKPKLCWSKVSELLNETEISDTVGLPVESRFHCDTGEDAHLNHLVPKLEKKSEEIDHESNSDSEQFFDAVSDIDELDIDSEDSKLADVKEDIVGKGLMARDEHMTRTSATSDIKLAVEKTNFEKEFQEPLKHVRKNCLLTERPGVKVAAMDNVGKDARYRSNLAILISAFANTDGGTIYIGMKGRGLVCGVQLTKKEIDNFFLLLDEIFSNYIHPSMKTTSIFLEHVPVEDSCGEKLEDNYLIKIQIKREQGIYYVVGLPGEPASMYRRKVRGPDHTYKVGRSEAVQLLGSTISMDSQRILTSYIRQLNM